MEIHPQKLHGSWDEGWALDIHTLSSEYVYDDPFGNPIFDTRRSDMGELVYQLKYRGHFGAAKRIAGVAHDFLSNVGLLEKIDLILPAPPTKTRSIQPAFVITEGIAELAGIAYVNDALVKKSDQEAKNISGIQKAAIASSIQFVRKLIRPCAILLVDDIFESGSTLNGCVGALRSDPNAKNIYVLTMTKTK